MPKSEQIALKSKRKIALYTLAKGDGERTIVLFHAAPGSGNFDPNPAETKKRKVALLAPDRPGYGDSRPVKKGEWATVSSAADDLAEILASKNLGPVGVAGWSAGGRVALALAARHPHLVDRVVVLATPAPDEFVPWIPPEQKAGIQAMRDLPPAQVHKQLAKQLATMIPANASTKKRLTLLGANPADDVALKYPRATARLAAMLKAAFAQGTAGLAADIAGYTMQPWGFEPADVQAKTLLLYGAQDPIANARHGAWWQQNLPHARLEIVPKAGHLLVIPMWQRVLAFLAPNR